MLTPQDAHNLLVLLNRVTATGVTEAQIVTVLAAKLTKFKETKSEDADGENSTPTA